MAHPRDGWQGQSCSKGGMHNLGGNIKEHTAAKFNNGGTVRRFADGDSVMFGDAPSAPAADDHDYRQDEPASSAGPDTSDYRADEPASEPMKPVDISGSDNSGAPPAATPTGLAGMIAGAKSAYAEARKNPVVAALNRAGESLGGAKDPAAAAAARTAAASGDTKTLATGGGRGGTAARSVTEAPTVKATAGGRGTGSTASADTPPAPAAITPTDATVTKNLATGGGRGGGAARTVTETAFKKARTGRG